MGRIYFISSNIILPTAVVVSIVCMTLITLYARSVEKRSGRYRYPSRIPLPGGDSCGGTRRNSVLGYLRSSIGGRQNPSLRTTIFLGVNDKTILSPVAVARKARKTSRLVATKGIMYSATIVMANLPTVVTFFFTAPWCLLTISVIRNLYPFYYLLVFLHNTEMKTGYGKLVQKIICRGFCCTSREDSQTANTTKGPAGEVEPTKEARHLSDKCNSSRSCNETSESTPEAENVSDLPTTDEDVKARDCGENECRE